MKRITGNHYTVYMHKVPNGRIYVGSTGQEDLRRRWRGGKGYRSRPEFWNDIQEYGWGNIKHDVIISGLSKNEARAIEKELIKQTCSEIGLLCYNQNDGGIRRDVGTNEYREAEREYHRHHTEQPAYKVSRREYLKTHREDPLWIERRKAFMKARKADPVWRERQKELREIRKADPVWSERQKELRAIRKAKRSKVVH